MNTPTVTFQNNRTASDETLIDGRVLIVDDDELLRELHETILSDYGYATAVAADGEEALTMLAAGGFDLVLTDSQMPNLDGFGLVRALRAAGNRIPVILLSGSLARIHELPADVCEEFSAALPKPTSNKELLAGIAEALRTHSTAAAPVLA